MCRFILKQSTGLETIKAPRPDGFQRYLLIGPMLGEGTEDFGGAGGLNAGVYWVSEF